MTYSQPVISPGIVPPLNAPRRGRVPLFIQLLVPLLVVGASQVRADVNIVANPGFEDGIASWGTFIPAESENKGCEFLVSKTGAHSGTSCAEMKAGELARFAIAPKTMLGDYPRPGERCRLTFWIRANKNVQAKGKPAFIVRFGLQDEQGAPLPANMALFVGLNGESNVQSMEKGLDLSGLGGDIPTVWTKVDCVFVVPSDAGTGRLGGPTFFTQYTSGSVYLDDVSLSRVPSNTPLSPTASVR